MNLHAANILIKSRRKVAAPRFNPFATRGSGAYKRPFRPEHRLAS